MAGSTIFQNWRQDPRITSEGAAKMAIKALAQIGQQANPAVALPEHQALLNVPLIEVPEDFMLGRSRRRGY